MRHDKIKLIIDIFLILFLAVSVVLAVYFYIHIKDLNVSVAPLNLFFYWAYFLLALAILFAFIVGPLVGMIQTPKSAIKGIISAAVLLGVVAIAYSFSSTTPVDLNIEIKNMTFALRLADTSLYSAYILGGLGIIAIIIAELKELLH